MRNLTAGDVVRAVREQNDQVAVGQIGQPPMHKGQNIQITLNTRGRLTEVEQFEKIILKTTPEGRVFRLKDVARVELGAKNQDVTTKMDGKDTIFLAIFQLPDANALATYDRVVAKMDELEKSFPEGVIYEVAFDTTPYTRESIFEVFKTLAHAIILVAIVVLLFLQNWRSALIPMVAVPVAIIGTFAVMAAIGFSLNNLTLFGLVLAIGIVVDDAIVVVEAVEHHIENGMQPREATFKAMEQVSGPVIAVGLVLSAVFVPCAFVSGITGQFFRQFALTIAVSTIISAFNSLTLSPALTALLLRPRDKETSPPLPWLIFPLLGGWLGWMLLAPRLEDVWESLPWLGDALAWAGERETINQWVVPAAGVLLGVLAGALAGRPINRALRWFFTNFNRGFAVATTLYSRGVGLFLRGTVIVLFLYLGLLGLTGWILKTTSKGFVPAQDMGYLMINVQLPDSASQERTQEVMNQLTEIARSVPGVRHATAITGQSFVLNAFGSNFGSMFINLHSYGLRQDPEQSSEAIANTLRRRFNTEVSDAQVAVFGPPPIRGVGRAGGYAIMIEDRGDVGPTDLQEQTENLVRKGNETPGLGNETGYPMIPVFRASVFGLRGVEADLHSDRLPAMFSVFRANVPQLHIHLNQDQALMRGVRCQDFADTLQVYEGSLYVNDFNLFGRTWQVNVQAESAFRDRPENLWLLKVRNAWGGMVPLGSLADTQEINGPLILTRYNMYPAASINGSIPPGTSSGDAIDLLQDLADEELPRNMNYEWTDMSYLELQAGDTATMILLCAVAMVFLVLAAQYESWSLPLAVILVVPMCLLSATIGVQIAKMDINIFTRIGFVVLVGLASKNAILIVEFAKVQRHAGKSRTEATLEACRLRLRPIVMTSLAFILGVLPLILSTGAGAEMRRTLGVAVFSGMIGVTLFGIFLTPVFFSAIDWLGGTRLFTNIFMQHLSAWALPLVTLGVPQAAGFLTKQPWKRRRSRVPAVKNGQPVTLPGAGSGERPESSGSVARPESAKGVGQPGTPFADSGRATQPEAVLPAVGGNGNGEGEKVSEAGKNGNGEVENLPHGAGQGGNGEQEPEVGGQKSEVRGQRSEVRDQKTEVGIQKSKDGLI
jgi:multidrug efflux pump